MKIVWLEVMMGFNLTNDSVIMIIFQARTVHAMLSSLFEIQSCIRGHHVYKNVSNAVCMQKVSLSGSPLLRNLNADVVGLPYADGLDSDVGHKPDVIDLSEHAHNYICLNM